MALSNSQYESIIRQIDARRMKAEEARTAALREVCERIPAYSDMESAIASDQADRIKAHIAGDRTRAESLQGRIAELREQQKVLLMGNGYPEDYTEAHYSCPLCRDRGLTDGKKCRCFRQAEAQLLYDASNIRDLLDRENFDTFDIKYFDRTYVDTITGRSAYDNMLLNLKTARKTCDEFCPGRQNLLFTGPAGTGKTFLSNCIARELICKGYSVIYLPSEGLFSRIAEGTFGRGQDDRDQIFGCDLLIIDDLGTEMVNSFVVSQLFTCINERRLRNRSTLISTNLDMNQIRDTYTERVSSRLLESYTICRFYNPDIRILKRQSGKTQ